MKVTQLCPTLCDCMNYTVHGILQARILEWVAYPFSRASSQPRNQTRVSCIAGRFFTNWAIKLRSEVGQSCATLGDPMDCSLAVSSICGIFQAREYWSGLPFPSPGDLPDPEIEPRSPALQADRHFILWATREAQTFCPPVVSDSPGQNTGVGSLSLLQEISPTQGWG